MVKLPSQSFPFGKYDGGTIPYEVQIMLIEPFLKWLRTQKIIGYIEGMELEIRPRTDSYGVLIEDEDGYETWSHISNDVWDKFLKETGD